MHYDDFTQYPDLASEKVGGVALIANDEFFAEKENLLKASEPIFIVDKYTDRGKWMDGWESRRSREPGYDWCIIQLGIPGVIHGVDIWTAHFTGNYPEHASLEACHVEGNPDIDTLLAMDTHWEPILAKETLQGGSHNPFAIANMEHWTHVRLNIFPDGGVARLKVYGEAAPDFSQFPKDEPIELSSIRHGGQVLLCNDMFFSPKENLILPTKAAHMGEGWETRRRRAPGNDWVILQLATPGTLSSIEVDTAHFKGNFPDACSIDACLIEDEIPLHFVTSRSLNWTEVLAPQRLEADHVHCFEDLQAPHQTFSHIRLNIFPDGGISRLRIWGHPDHVERLNQMPRSTFVSTLTRCCGSHRWVQNMWSAAPFTDKIDVLTTAERIADTLTEEDWLEAFDHHPQIGDLESLKTRFADTASVAAEEQAGSLNAHEDTLIALAQQNQVYLQKFGFIFIVCATGKSAEEMLALLQARLSNDRDTELRIAAGEQRKITQLRLEHLL